MRVYELAKKLGMESRILIPELVQLGIEVTSHSNTLDDDSVRRALEALQGKKVTDIAEDSKKRPRKSSSKAASVAKKDKGQAATAVEEPKKPEKKHILIKKKKVEEEPQPESLDSDLRDRSLIGVSEADVSAEATSLTKEDSEVPSALSPEVAAVDNSLTSPTVAEDSATGVKSDSGGGCRYF